MKDFIKGEWKTILITAIFVGTLFGVYYHLEHRPETKETHIFNCLHQGHSLAGLELGQSAGQVASFLKDEGTVVEGSLDGITTLAYIEGQYVVSYKGEKSIMIEYYPEDMQEETAAHCLADSEYLEKRSSPDGSRIYDALLRHTPYDGWYIVESRDSEEDRVWKVWGWKVGPHI